MLEYQKSYRLKYTVKCKLQNFFKKEMVVKKCMSEMHAKAKLDTYCKKKYGVEYLCIIVISCAEDEDVMGMFNNMFGNIFGKDMLKDKKSNTQGYYDDIMNRLKKTQKK